MGNQWRGAHQPAHGISEIHHFRRREIIERQDGLYGPPAIEQLLTQRSRQQTAGQRGCLQATVAFDEDARAAAFSQLSTLVQINDFIAAELFRIVLPFAVVEFAPRRLMIEKEIGAAQPRVGDDLSHLGIVWGFRLRAQRH